MATFKAISDGTYTFSETEKENQFYFFRNDEEVLSDDVHKDIIRLYQVYITQKMMEGEIENSFINNYEYEISANGKCIRLTIYDIKLAPKSNAPQKQPNIFKRLFNKLFK